MEVHLSNLKSLPHFVVLLLFYLFHSVHKLKQLMTNYRVLKDKGVYILVNLPHSHSFLSTFLLFHFIFSRLFGGLFFSNIKRKRSVGRLVEANPKIASLGGWILLPICIQSVLVPFL